MDACAGNVTDVCKIGQELLMSVRNFSQCVACTLILQGMVGGRPTRMLVDTGSSVTLVHEKVWNDISQDRKLLTPQCPVMAVNGDSLSLCGQIDLDLMVGKHVRTHTVLVVREMTQEC